MSFPGYPAYKHSGVKLLGEFPGHWTLKRFKNVFAERVERSTEGAEELLSVSAYFGIKPRSETLDEGDHLSRAESLEGYKVCQAGDLVINIMLAWNRGLGFSWQRGIVSPAYCVFYVTDGSVPEFLDYLVRSDECIRYFKTHSAGIMDSRLRLYPESFGRLFTAIPPACEQAQIAHFLDHETARIDALIEEQQRLIELLKEKRQAVISHAVTKGLDPTVPMKDSSVEWLGEVPAHWKVVRLKNISRIVDCKNRTPEYVEDGEYLVVRTSNIKKQHLSLDNALYTDRRNFEIWTERGIPPPGSIFFTREAPSGEVCIVPADTALCMGQRMMNIIPTDSELTPFVFDFLTSDCLARYIESEASGSTVVHLRVEQVYNIPLVVPPKVERDEIDKLVGQLKAQYEILITQSEASVVLLCERRSALISAAVSGKIDVRGWQPLVSVQAPLLEAEAV
ncbi:restriction endonuclease subunit S [Pseudomonas nabeulensis]|uniref:Restriction endonuclease subunit S n=1 Tax=Pseudomonas nabeulensis TaxID=2293833 RepID=A0A4Z0AG35_9PSED|nr:restriction endonuclease subunit S [Pseudomonas nabeulensis]TFY85722.1 restriction endonuclease subunit S [Pseudomonas nabeulensis]